MRLVSNKPLREAFEARSISARDIAFQLGYIKNCKGRKVPDSSQVLRALGLKSHRSHGYDTKQELIGEEKALKLAEALGLFPVDVGL